MNTRYQKEQIDGNVLHECIALASPGYRIFVKVYKLQLSEWFENLLNVAFREVEVE
jgi:hypothetical protein